MKIDSRNILELDIIEILVDIDQPYSIELDGSPGTMNLNWILHRKP